MESFRGIFLPYPGCILRIFEVKSGFLKEKRIFIQNSQKKFGSIEKMRTFAIPNDKNNITVGSYNG